MIRAMKGNVRIEKKEDGFWSNGSFIESVSPNDAAKMMSINPSKNGILEHVNDTSNPRYRKW